MIMVRDYIITETEQKIIKAFLERNEKLEGFRVLVHRLRKLDLKSVETQIDMIQKFLQKINNSKE